MKKFVIALILFYSFIPSVMAETEENQKPSNLLSESGIMIDTDTGTVLYSKNANKRMSPASITKVATAVYAIEKGELDSMVTISKEAAETGGSSVYLIEGEQMSLKQLLIGMMINSGNDASAAIAEHLDGSVENFSKNINKFLEEKAGVQNSHFTNPHGLYEEDHYTTAGDMALIIAYAMKNEDFQELFSLKQVEWKGEGWETTLFNHHKMVKGEMVFPEVTGGKNGYVDESKHTLVTTAASENLSIAVVLLKAQSKAAVYQDTEALLKYGLNQFRHNIIPEGERYAIDGKEFFSDKEIVYTSLMGEEDLIAIDGKGGLVYTLDGDEQLLSMLPAFPEEPEDREKEEVQDESSSHVNSQLVLYPVYLYFGLLLIAAAGAFRNKRTAG
ncbi:D-alanyl-D-alanine carboxypeptidase family protein [Bacillus sp. P14.5]|uniref:D-alanyl-D-alanine carboxypeptidase family protein n=1 Tax=Bacillus sp. P14.5 TaxID=1983400 RepID=UPI000DE8C5C7|nr:D-alanyl-D-alanine carboxypeptidase family protein [Bacillus sp. P14.5]